jgi:hypothetical protein
MDIELFDMGRGPRRVVVDLTFGGDPAALPRFTYRMVSRDEHLRRCQFIEQAEAIDRDDRVSGRHLAKLAEALAIGLVGWVGLTHPGGSEIAFDAADVGRVFDALTINESWALLRAAAAATALKRGG